MKRFFLAAGLAAFLTGGLAGCASNHDVKYVNPGGRESVKTLGIDLADVQQTAEKMVASLLASGKLDAVPTPPALIVVSLVVNNTTQNLDTALLTTKIRIALNQSGKAQTRMNFGVGADGQPLVTDPQGKAIETLKGASDPVRVPDFSLSGRIIETRARAGNTREVTFTFQMALTRNGVAVWEDEKELSKQGTRPSVSF